MPRTLIITLVVMLLRVMLPSLKAEAAKSSNPVDYMLIKVLESLVGLYDTGELKQLLNSTPAT